MKKILIYILIVLPLLTSCNIITEFLEGNENYNEVVIEDTDALHENLEYYELDNLIEQINKISLEAMKANVMIKTVSSKIVRNTRLTSTYVSQGSGVIFKENQNNYYILTNNHVLYGDDDYPTWEYNVYDYLGREYKADLIAKSDKFDLGLLKIAKSADLYVLSMASSNPKVNDIIITLGQPKGQYNFLSLGYVEEYTQLTLDNELSNIEFPVIKHSAPINSGSSGGALLNSDLQIVGVNYAGLFDNDKNHIAGYAIPIEKVIIFLLNNQ